MESKLEIRMYVACLAAYNRGILHGEWIDANQSIEAIWEGICGMLDASPCPNAEEYAIQDYEGFEGVRIEEFASIDRVSALAQFIAERGRLGAELVKHFCGDLDDAQNAMNERYIGTYESLADYMEKTTEEYISVPRSLLSYIDWQAMAGRRNERRCIYDRGRP